jgi:predicted ester cyclase
MYEENRELARLFREELWNTGRLEIADQILTKDCRIEARVPFQTDFVVGPEALKQLLLLYRETFAGIRMQIQDTIAEHDRVSARWEGKGVHTGALFLPEAKGRAVATSGIDFFVIREGRIAEGWVAWDLFGLLRSLGMPLPGDADWQETTTRDSADDPPAG